MLKKFLAILLSLMLLACAFAALAEETHADDEIVDRIYTLENAMETPITSLYVYESRGQNLVPDGLKPGEQIQVNVSGRYLHTPNQTLYTVEFVSGGETYAIRTLHVEDLFNVLYLKGTDAVSGATVVSFTNPDGSAQQVEEVEAPGEDEIVTRTYTLENAMDKRSPSCTSTSPAVRTWCPTASSPASRCRPKCSATICTPPTRRCTPSNIPPRATSSSTPTASGRCTSRTCSRCST